MAYLTANNTNTSAAAEVVLAAMMMMTVAAFGGYVWPVMPAARPTQTESHLMDGGSLDGWMDGEEKRVVAKRSGGSKVGDDWHTAVVATAT